MSTIIYVPLEHIDSRYTKHLDEGICKYLQKRKMRYYRISSMYNVQPPPKGHFLNSSFTIQSKALQMQQIAELYNRGEITNNTKFFFSDLWFPGIEALAYLNYFYKVKPKITGIIHAGSFTDTDFVRDMERWASLFENIVFDIADEIYCASNFIKSDIIKKRIVNERKLIVTGLPLDEELAKYQNPVKENIVIFNGRLCDEKQPHLFWALRDKLVDKGWRFVSTQETNLTKPEYYKLLAKSKIVVSFALQENFGFGIAEAIQLGCVPILPNRLVYPELYGPRYLYNSFEECVSMTAAAMLKAPPLPTILPFNNYNIWL